MFSLSSMQSFSCNALSKSTVSTKYHNHPKKKIHSPKKKTLFLHKHSTPCSCYHRHSMRIQMYHGILNMVGLAHITQWHKQTFNGNGVFGTRQLEASMDGVRRERSMDRRRDIWHTCWNCQWRSRVLSWKAGAWHLPR